MKVIKQTTGYISAATRVLLAAVLLLMGCVERELEMRPLYGDGTAEISLDWGELSNPPQSARCLFYNEAGQLVKEIKGVTDVVEQTLYSGRYHLIVYNEDGRQVSYRGTESYETAEVFALPSTDIRAADLPCILEPQATYGTGTCRDGEWLVIKPGKTTRATVAPEALTRQVQVHFVVKGGLKVKVLTGVLNGVASSALLATGEIGSSERCALNFIAVISQSLQDGVVDVGRITAELDVFNLLVSPDCPAGTATTDLVLIDDADTRYDTSIDLTSVLKEIMLENGGTIPKEVSVEITIKKTVGDITSTVRPWDDSGTGGGGPTWD